MLTRNGVCYDLKLSPFKCRQGEYVFVFSSQLHLDKFKEKLHENREAINKSIARRFKIEIDVSLLADFYLYRKIENRGFLIVARGENNICQSSNLKFVGGNLMMKNYEGK